MNFGSLLEVAMAGTQRRQIVAALPAFADLPPESRLLRSASYEGLRRLAGRPPDPIQGVFVVDPCAPETLPPLPASAGAQLLSILTDRPGLLLEWLSLAVARNRRVAHDCLPDLLEYARSHPDVHDLVMQVGGERLVWLAELNPDWHFAARGDPELQFALGTPEERVRALRRIRRQHAARGRELLQVVFDGRSERAEMRAALLDALTAGLSAADEPVVMQAVQDSRRELREKGLRLIRRVPNSRFSQRWIERARQVVVMTESTIDVHPPDEPDPAWMVDGLDPRPPKGIGATAWVLQQVVALTPPSIWPHAVLGAIQRSDWAQPLLSGLAQAAVAYADADWSETLLMAVANAEVVRGVHSAALLGVLPPDRAEAVVGRLFDAPASGHATLAMNMKHAWSEDFSQVILTRLPALLVKWQYATSALLHEAPLRLDPGVLPAAEQLLEDYAGPAWARPALQRLVRTLEFRAAMRAELEPA
jgi:hypothetical protein